MSRILLGDEGAPVHPARGQHAPRSEMRTDSMSGLQRFTQSGHSPSSGTRETHDWTMMINGEPLKDEEQGEDMVSIQGVRSLMDAMRVWWG